MHKYETLFILNSELGEAQVKEAIERARKLIESMQGTMEEVQEWGLRELAYPIDKKPRGIYSLLRYTASSDAVAELERTLKIADDVLRYVSVRIPEPQKINRRVASKKRRADAAEAAQQAQQAQQEVRQGD